MIESPERIGEFEGIPTVFVVEDDVSVRESIELLISEAGWRPQLFSTAREFLVHQMVNAPRCLVLDIRLPDISGLDLQRSLNAGAEIPVIFITGSANISMTVQAMKAGAFEFLAKPFDNDALLSAIGQALRSSHAALARKSRLQALEQAYNSLSGREREVMELVVSGLLNKQIAGHLGISETTVKTHRGHMTRKMKAGSVAALVKLDLELRHVSAQNRSPAGLGARTSLIPRPSTEGDVSSGNDPLVSGAAVRFTPDLLSSTLAALHRHTA